MAYVARALARRIAAQRGREAAFQAHLRYARSSAQLDVRPIGRRLPPFVD
jgi:hypothetical protein